MLVLLILLIVLYTKHSTRFATDYEIVQLFPFQLTPSILLERRPIVVALGDDHDQKELISKSLKFMYMYQTEHIVNSSDKFKKNKARFAIFVSSPEKPQSNNTQNVIYISNPKEKSSKDENMPSIAIAVPPKFCLILPMFWYYKNIETCHVHFVHDIFSSLYQTVFSTLQY